jgi:hypothetical protein
MVYQTGGIKHEFPSKQACEVAKEQSLEAFTYRNMFGEKLNRGAYAVCVPSE